MSHEGNCDLCFLKGRDKVRAIMFDRPDLADWWVSMEAEVHAHAEERAAALTIDDAPKFTIAPVGVAPDDEFDFWDEGGPDAESRPTTQEEREEWLVRERNRIAWTSGFQGPGRPGYAALCRTRRKQLTIGFEDDALDGCLACTD